MSGVLIVEDNVVIANGLAKIINSIDNKLDITITGYAEKALNYTKNNNYDAFLLDIQLEDYSGIELAKSIREIDEYKLTPIVFITAIPTRELMAFKEIHCYDYIIKPFREEEVREVLETIIHHGIKREQKSEIFKINQKSYSYILKQDEIIYIESKNKNLLIVTKNENIELSNYTMSKILKELNIKFFQCHKGYIINCNYISKIDHKDNLIKLKGTEERIPIGRKYKEDVRNIVYDIN